MIMINGAREASVQRRRLGMAFLRAVKAAPAVAAGKVSGWIAVAAFWVGGKIDAAATKLSGWAWALESLADDIREGL